MTIVARRPSVYAATRPAGDAEIAIAVVARVWRGYASITWLTFVWLGNYSLIDRRESSDARAGVAGLQAGLECAGFEGRAGGQSARAQGQGCVMEGMSQASVDRVREEVGAVYRSESRRVLATLIRLLGDFDLAEDALQDAFAAAVERWPRDGVPENPRAWLVSAGRFKGIDALRRRARFDASLPELATRLDDATAGAEAGKDESVEDDRLRLIFTCCHPALSVEAQIALTLRTVCGLTTEEIAHAFLTQPSTVAQRIVRAKAKIRDARIPYEVPTREELPERVGAVLFVVYLVFNEGYSASSGPSLTRPDLSAEAIRLGRLIAELLSEPEAVGLLALMLLARIAAVGPHDAGRGPDPFGRAGSLPLEPRADRRRPGAGQPGAFLLGGWSLYAAGRHLSGPRRGVQPEHDGLGADRRTVRCAAAGGALPGNRVEPSRGRCHAGWSGGRTRPDRGDPRSRRSHRLSSGALRAGGAVPAIGKNGGSSCCLRAGPRPHSPGTGAPVCPATAARPVKLKRHKNISRRRCRIVGPASDYFMRQRFDRGAGDFAHGL